MASEAKLPQQAATLRTAESGSSTTTTTSTTSTSSTEGIAAQPAGGDAGLPQVPKKPIACIVVGMAGSGKTTFMQVTWLLLMAFIYRSSDDDG